MVKRPRVNAFNGVYHALTLGIWGVVSAGLTRLAAHGDYIHPLDVWSIWAILGCAVLAGAFVGVLAIRFWGKSDLQPPEADKYWLHYVERYLGPEIEVRYVTRQALSRLSENPLDSPTRRWIRTWNLALSDLRWRVIYLDCAWVSPRGIPRLFRHCALPFVLDHERGRLEWGAQPWATALLYGQLVLRSLILFPVIRWSISKRNKPAGPKASVSEDNEALASRGVDVYGFGEAFSWLPGLRDGIGWRERVARVAARQATNGQRALSLDRSSNPERTFKRVLLRNGDEVALFWVELCDYLTDLAANREWQARPPRKLGREMAQSFMAHALGEESCGEALAKSTRLLLQEIFETRPPSQRTEVEIGALLESPVTKLLERYRKEARARFLESSKARDLQIAMDPRGSLAIISLSGLLFSGILWGFVGALALGVTGAVLLGFISQFVLLPLLLTLFRGLEERREGAGTKRTLAFHRFAFGLRGLPRAASINDLERVYEEQIAQCHTYEKNEPAFQLFILEGILRVTDTWRDSSLLHAVRWMRGRNRVGDEQASGLWATYEQMPTADPPLSFRERVLLRRALRCASATEGKLKAVVYAGLRAGIDAVGAALRLAGIPSSQMSMGLRNKLIMRLSGRPESQYPIQYRSRDRVSPPSPSEKDQNAFSSLLKRLSALGIPELDRLLGQIREEFSPLYQDFDDPSWSPWIWRLARLKKKRPSVESQYQLDLVQRVLVLSSRAPWEINGLALVKLGAFAFRHKVIGGLEESIHVGDATLDRLRWSVFRAILRSYWKSTFDDRKSLGRVMYAVWIGVWVLGVPIYSSKAEPGILRSRRRWLWVRWRDNLKIMVNLWGGWGNLGMTDQVSFHHAQSEPEKPPAFLNAVGTLMKSLKHGGRFAASFAAAVTLLTGFWNLDFGWLDRLLTSWLPWLRDWAEWLRARIDLSLLEDLLLWAHGYLASIGVWLINHVTPWVYAFALPIFLAGWGLIHGALVYEGDWARRMRDWVKRWSAPVREKLSHWAGRAGPRLARWIQHRGESSETSPTVHGALRKMLAVWLRHQAKSWPRATRRLTQAAAKGLAVGLYLMIWVPATAVYIFLLVGLAFPPLDVPYVFHALQSVGIPVSSYAFIGLVTFIVGIPFSLLYGAGERLGRWIPNQRRGFRRWIMVSALSIALLLTAILPGAAHLWIKNTPRHAMKNLLIVDWEEKVRSSGAREISSKNWDHLRRDLLRRLVNDRFQGSKGLIDPALGRPLHMGDVVPPNRLSLAEWVEANKEQVMEGLQGKTSAYYGNSPLWAYMGTGRLWIGDVLSPEQCQEVLKHLLAIVRKEAELGGVLSYRDRFFLEAQAFEGLQYFLWGDVRHVHLRKSDGQTQLENSTSYDPRFIRIDDQGYQLQIPYPYHEAWEEAWLAFQELATNPRVEPDLRSAAEARVMSFQSLAEKVPLPAGVLHQIGETFDGRIDPFSWEVKVTSHGERAQLLLDLWRRDEFELAAARNGKKRATEVTNWTERVWARRVPRWSGNGIDIGPTAGFQDAWYDGKSLIRQAQERGLDVGLILSRWNSSPERFRSHGVSEFESLDDDQRSPSTSFLPEMQSTFEILDRAGMGWQERQQTIEFLAREGIGHEEYDQGLWALGKLVQAGVPVDEGPELMRRAAELGFSPTNTLHSTAVLVHDGSVPWDLGKALALRFLELGVSPTLSFESLGQIAQEASQRRLSEAFALTRDLIEEGEDPRDTLKGLSIILKHAPNRWEQAIALDLDGQRLRWLAKILKFSQASWNSAVELISAMNEREIDGNLLPDISMVAEAAPEHLPRLFQFALQVVETDPYAVEAVNELAYLLVTASASRDQVLDLADHLLNNGGVPRGTFRGLRSIVTHREDLWEEVRTLTLRMLGRGHNGTRTLEALGKILSHAPERGDEAVRIAATFFDTYQKEPPFLSDLADLTAAYPGDWPSYLEVLNHLRLADIDGGYSLARGLSAVVKAKPKRWRECVDLILRFADSGQSPCSRSLAAIVASEPTRWDPALELARASLRKGLDSESALRGLASVVKTLPEEWDRALDVAHALIETERDPGEALSGIVQLMELGSMTWEDSAELIMRMIEHDVRPDRVLRSLGSVVKTTEGLHRSYWDELLYLAFRLAELGFDSGRTLEILGSLAWSEPSKVGESIQLSLVVAEAGIDPSDVMSNLRMISEWAPRGWGHAVELTLQLVSQDKELDGVLSGLARIARVSPTHWEQALGLIPLLLEKGTNPGSSLAGLASLMYGAPNRWEEGVELALMLVEAEVPPAPALQGLGVLMAEGLHRWEPAVDLILRHVEAGLPPGDTLESLARIVEVDAGEWDRSLNLVSTFLSYKLSAAKSLSALSAVLEAVPEKYDETVELALELLARGDDPASSIWNLCNLLAVDPSEWETLLAATQRFAERGLDADWNLDSFGHLQSIWSARWREVVLLAVRLMESDFEPRWSTRALEVLFRESPERWADAMSFADRSLAMGVDPRWGLEGLSRIEKNASGTWRQSLKLADQLMNAGLDAGPALWYLGCVMRVDVNKGNEALDLARRLQEGGFDPSPSLEGLPRLLERVPEAWDRIRHLWEWYLRAERDPGISLKWLDSLLCEDAERGMQALDLAIRLQELEIDPAGGLSGLGQLAHSIPDRWPSAFGLALRLADENIDPGRSLWGLIGLAMHAPEEWSQAQSLAASLMDRGWDPARSLWALASTAYSLPAVKMEVFEMALRLSEGGLDPGLTLEGLGGLLYRQQKDQLLYVDLAWQLVDLGLDPSHTLIGLDLMAGISDEAVESGYSLVQEMLFRDMDPEQTLAYIALLAGASLEGRNLSWGGTWDRVPALVKLDPSLSEGVIGLAQLLAAHDHHPQPILDRLVELRIANVITSDTWQTEVRRIEERVTEGLQPLADELYR